LALSLALTEQFGYLAAQELDELTRFDYVTGETIPVINGDAQKAQNSEIQADDLAPANVNADIQADNKPDIKVEPQATAPQVQDTPAEIPVEPSVETITPQTQDTNLPPTLEDFADATTSTLSTEFSANAGSEEAKRQHIYQTHIDSNSVHRSGDKDREGVVAQGRRAMMNAAVSELAEIRSQIDTLNSELDGMRLELGDLEILLEELRETRENLTAERDTLSEAAEYLDTPAGDALEVAVETVIESEAQGSPEEIEVQLVEEQAQVQTLEERQTELSAQRAGLEEQMDSLQVQIDDLQVEVETRSGFIDRLEEANGYHFDEDNNSYYMIDDMDGTIIEVSGPLADYLLDMRADNALQNQNIRGLETEMGHAGMSLGRLANAEIATGSSLADRLKTIDDLSTARVEQTAARDTLETALDELSAENPALAEIFREFISDGIEPDEWPQALEDRIASVDSELATVILKQADTEVTIADLQANILLTENRVEELEIQEAELTTAANAHLDIATEELSFIESATAGLTNSVSGLMSWASSFASEDVSLESITSDVNDFNADLEALEAAQAEVQQSLVYNLENTEILSIEYSMALRGEYDVRQDIASEIMGVASPDELNMSYQITVDENDPSGRMQMNGQYLSPAQQARMEDALATSESTYSQLQDSMNGISADQSMITALADQAASFETELVSLREQRDGLEQRMEDNPENFKDMDMLGLIQVAHLINTSEAKIAEMTQQDALSQELTTFIQSPEFQDQMRTMLNTAVGGSEFSGVAPVTMRDFFENTVPETLQGFAQHEFAAFFSDEALAFNDMLHVDGNEALREGFGEIMVVRSQMKLENAEQGHLNQSVENFIDEHRNELSAEQIEYLQDSFTDPDAPEPQTTLELATPLATTQEPTAEVADLNVPTTSANILETLGVSQPNTNMSVAPETIATASETLSAGQWGSIDGEQSVTTETNLSAKFSHADANRLPIALDQQPSEEITYTPPSQTEPQYSTLGG